MNSCLTPFSVSSPAESAHAGGVAEAVLAIANEAETAALAGRLATAAQAGDVLCLTGPLGAGKSAFARAFIHARAAMAGVPAPDVPSPTFTLVQTYALGPVLLSHLDLYRVGDPEELLEIGIEEALAGISLVEWPDRLGPWMPADRLDVAIGPAHDDPQARRIALVGRGRAARLVAAGKGQP